MTATELRKAEARYRRASSLAEEARKHRNAMVRVALGEGWTHARISETIGLTRGRVGQIAQERDATAVLERLREEKLRAPRGTDRGEPGSIRGILDSAMNSVGGVLSEEDGFEMMAKLRESRGGA